MDVRGETGALGRCRARAILPLVVPDITGLDWTGLMNPCFGLAQYVGTTNHDYDAR